MKILAIGGFFHDLNFAYLDTEIGCDSLIAVEEERFSRQKQHKIQGNDSTTIYGLNYIVNKENIDLRNIDILLLSDKAEQPIYKFFKDKIPAREVVRVGHHICHAFNVVAFNEALKEGSLIFTFDAYGDSKSGSIIKVTKSGCEILEEFSSESSLGIIYTAATSHLGLGGFGSEGKMQGLASYGTYNPKYSIKKFLITNTKTESIVVSDILRLSDSSPDQEMYSENNDLNIDYFHDIIDSCFPGEEFTQDHKDFAHTIQRDIFESIGEVVSNQLLKGYDLSYVGVSGGVAQNSSLIGYLNKKFADLTFLTSTSCSDRGNSVGPLRYYLQSQNKSIQEFNPYLGLNADDFDLKNDSRFSKVDVTNVFSFLGNILDSNNIICTYLGKAEYGARALGNRSIIANPQAKEMRDILNHEIKHRDLYRPFAPIMIDKAYQIEFGRKDNLEYMTECIQSSSLMRERYPSAVHIDGTCRIQVAKKGRINDFIYNMLLYLYEHNDLRVLINTSLNDAGEAIVNTPDDLYATMKKCNLQYVATRHGVYAII